MESRGRYLSLIAWMVVALILAIFVALVREPLHEAAWAQPCAALARGEAIPGTWDTIQPCRDLRR